MIRISISARSQHWKVWPRIIPSILLGYMTLATPTHLQAYKGQGSPTSERFSRLKTVYSTRNGAPTKTEQWFLCPFVLSQCLRRLLSASQDSCMPCAQHVVCPPPPIQLFSLAQNLYSRWIAQTDNMWPQLYDDYTRRQWLKGSLSWVHMNHSDCSSCQMLHGCSDCTEITVANLARWYFNSHQILTSGSQFLKRPKPVMM